MTEDAENMVLQWSLTKARRLMKSIPRDIYYSCMIGTVMLRVNNAQIMKPRSPDSIIDWIILTHTYSRNGRNIILLRPGGLIRRTAFSNCYLPPWWIHELSVGHDGVRIKPAEHPPPKAKYFAYVTLNSQFCLQFRTLTFWIWETASRSGIQGCNFSGHLIFSEIFRKFPEVKFEWFTFEFAHIPWSRAKASYIFPNIMHKVTRA